jgi:IPT/TIG domain
MAPFKRYLGLRVAAVASVVSLLVLGLQTPASAASPTISSFSPTSGPAGCVVVILGTNFKDPTVTSVDIGGTAVSAFKVVSGKEIWATVAGDASGTIHVTNTSATANSASDFTNANPGGCSPTITLITPCSGAASWGTVVTIFGTNLLKSSGTTTTAPIGADVRFAPYTETAIHTGTQESPRLLTVLVPPGTIDGQIRVSTFNDIVGEGAVLGPSFFVPEPHCDPVPHLRSVTLHLVRSLVARGVVSDDQFTVCAASVPVKIQRRVAGEWETVKTTSTSPTGSYEIRIPDKAGRYRATAPTFPSGSVLTPCYRVMSPVRTGS